MDIKDLINASPERPSERTLAIKERSTGLTVKRQSKWSPAEDKKILKLRESGTTWKDISKELPGRSAISCRLHYQNYLERRLKWNEDQRNRLAMVYHRLKEEIWKPVAKELGIPWRACEAIHWTIGQQQMARRADTTTFAVDAAHTESNESGYGRVAQRDRLTESTRTLEDYDVTSFPSSFTSVNGGNHHHRPGHGLGHGTLGYPPVSVPPIKDEQLSDYGEE